MDQSLISLERDAQEQDFLLFDNLGQDLLKVEMND